MGTSGISNDLKNKTDNVALFYNVMYFLSKFFLIFLLMMTPLSLLTFDFYTKESRKREVTEHNKPKKDHQFRIGEAYELHLHLCIRVNILILIILICHL